MRNRVIASMAAIKVQQTSVERLYDSGIGIYYGSEITRLNIEKINKTIYKIGN
jgi:hypothetical protein